MSISQALSNAASGLGAASRQAGLASQNIANALTPGYARREISLAERVVAGRGAGVRVAGVDRAAAPALARERRLADGVAARDETRLAAAEKIRALFGGPEDQGSIFARLAAFDHALRDLANQPAGAAALEGAVARARHLATGINDAAHSLQALRQDADGAIAAEVERVNAALAGIVRLNGEIERAVVAGRDANAFMDERDRQLDLVNRALPSRALIRDNGRIDLMTLEGVALIAGEARQLSFTPTPVIAAGQTYAGGALSGLLVGGVDIAPGGGTQAISAGALAGLFALRDEIAPEAAADLDAFAAELIGRFAAPGVDPTAPAGAAGLFTDAGAALGGPYAPGLAARLALNGAVDPRQGGEAFRLRDGVYAAGPGPVGSNAILVNLLAALDAPRPSALSGGALATAADAAAGLVARRGARLAEMKAEAAGSGAYRDALREAELAETGVDADAELQQLLLIEQAYAANARVIEVAARLIDRLMEL